MAAALVESVTGVAKAPAFSQIVISAEALRDPVKSPFASRVPLPARQLWVPGPLPGMNEVVEAAKGAGGRGAKYARLKREWSEAVWAYARNCRLPPVSGPVVFSFEWREKYMTRDPDNIVSAKKFILDGLVLAHVLPDDGWRWVRGFREEWFVDPVPGVMVRWEPA